MYFFPHVAFPMGFIWHIKSRIHNILFLWEQVEDKTILHHFDMNELFINTYILLLYVICDKYPNKYDTWKCQELFQMLEIHY